VNPFPFLVSCCSTIERNVEDEDQTSDKNNDAASLPTSFMMRGSPARKAALDSPTLLLARIFLVI